MDAPEILVNGRPGDDWPGIPGVGWGMGSRVIAMVPQVVRDGSGKPVVRPIGRPAMVVGALLGGPEEYVITVRLSFPMDGYLHCLPSQLQPDHG